MTHDGGPGPGTSWAGGTGDRRRFLQSTAGLVTGLVAAGPAGAERAARSDAPARRIATEEAFSTPEIAAATTAYMTSSSARDEPGLAALRASVALPTAIEWGRRLVEFGDMRRGAMAAAGIDMQVLLMSSPGVQIFPPDQAGELARRANDMVAAQVRADPRRYAALATIAPQAPRAAADELTRAVRELGCRGALINSSTKGRYLDDPQCWPIFEAAQALDVPIYLHPREPSPGMVAPFAQARMTGSIWGFEAETGLHAIRLILGQVFDNFPRLQIILGHGGEGLPYFIDRIDTRFAKEVLPGGARPLKRRPSDYLRENFHVTTSGMNWNLPIRHCIAVMGIDRVLFAADYPFEDTVEAVRTFEASELTATERRNLRHLNAERLFKLG